VTTHARGGTPPTPFSHADVRRLKLVLDAGAELEKIWIDLPAPSDLAGSRRREHALERLSAAIHALEQADSENIRRLSFHTRNLSLEMTARHLATVLVPFERLQGKALRDDEILIEEGDRATAIHATAPMRVIADNLRSAFNVGAVLRTAECFGVEHVSLSGYTPTPDSEKTARTSLGTEKSVSWSSDPNVHDVIAQAKSDGYEVVALETAQSAVTLSEFKWPEKCALILGNERFGLDRDVIDLADYIVKIPMHGTKNSLNVGIACGIALASWREQVGQNHDPQISSADRVMELNPDGHREVTYKSIAIFRSNAIHPYEAPRQASLDISGHEGVIDIKGLPHETLKDLEGFDRIWLLYDFHHNKNWKSLVLPPRGPHEKRGVFATRSPYRPNSIGLSSVELVRIEGTKIIVKGTDLLDGTPILDIKPYVTYADSFPTSKQGWLEGLDKNRFDVAFSQVAEAKLKWLEENGVETIRGFLIQQLEFDPSDEVRKRVSTHGKKHRLSYRTWRADFQFDESTRDLVVNDLSSGYTAIELSDSVDKHGDKDLHRKFIAQIF
jgi:tRNA-Thr(GGU) m(6)t(6)A37 methyltransferase TsaA